MIKSFSEEKWRVIPGNGKSVGNYVFIDDVVEGHLLAMEKGIAGEQYILGGENISYIVFFEILRKLNKRNHFMFKLPLFLMLTAANFMMLSTKLFGTKPLITPALVRKFNFHWNVSSEKANKELGYKPVSFEEGAGKTLDWIKRI
jgi:nucleoside-diphosphate-sugar epimerase